MKGQQASKTPLVAFAKRKGFETIVNVCLASKTVIKFGTKTGRHCCPAGWSVLHIVFDSLDFGFGEDREAVGNQVNRVVGLAFDLVFRLADASGDADKIADAGFMEPFAQSTEQGDAVPGISLWGSDVHVSPLRLAQHKSAAVVIGGKRNVGDGLGGIDPADQSDTVRRSNPQP